MTGPCELPEVPGNGTWIDERISAEPSVVADTLDEARGYYAQRGEQTRYLHSMVGICHVLGHDEILEWDCHQGARLGDTTIAFVPDRGREVEPHECRVWRAGPPPWGLKVAPLHSVPGRYALVGRRSQRIAEGPLDEMELLLRARSARLDAEWMLAQPDDPRRER